MNAQIQTSLELEKLSPTIGAIVHGVDMGKPVGEVVRAELYQALLDHKVIFFRDQDISTEQHIAFSRLFGDLEVHPFTSNKSASPEVICITHDKNSRGKENAWHSDVTWREEPSLGSLLRAIEVPDVGGDTLFADMEAAYEHLSQTLKDSLEGKTALHDFTHFRRRFQKEGKQEELAALERRYPNPEHPVIRTHPDTGRKSIYVNIGFTRHIVGMQRDESDKLLKYLYSRAAIPEYQCRFRWQKNSVAFWDNRSCQHYATSDYWPEVRQMERVTVVGGKPV